MPEDAASSEDWPAVASANQTPPTHATVASCPEPRHPELDSPIAGCQADRPEADRHAPTHRPTDRTVLRGSLPGHAVRDRAAKALGGERAGRVTVRLARFAW